MKVMVTGGAGFAGSHVVDGLIQKGYQVIVVDDLSTGFLENVAPQATFYQMDITHPDLASIFERERPDYVNHHAAQISVGLSLRDPMDDARINILGSLNLIVNCQRFGVKKIVYASTGGAVYGEPIYLPCDESHPINPICPYGIAKHTVEHYLYLYKQLYGLDYTILRYPNVYGPRQYPYGEAGVVAIFAQQILRDDQVKINGSGEQERDFVYVSDIVKANLLALEHGDGDIYNLGWGQGVSVNRIFYVLRELTAYTREPVHNPPIPGEVFKISLNAAKAKREMGWRSVVPLEEGLSRTVEYFRSHR